MPEPVEVIRTIKWICVALLVLVVGIGVHFYDKRFTILFLPPYLFYMSQSLGAGWVNELPIVMLLNRVFKPPFGPYLLAFLGLGAGAYINGWIEL